MLPRRYDRRIDRPRILLVCTANQCRSPMAEGLLRELLQQRGIDAEVRSAGLLPGGSPATSTAVAVLAERGIDLTAHRSRPLSEGELDDADLVVAMERRHLQEAVLLDPSARGRSFTLIDLVRRIEVGGCRNDAEELRAWARRLSAERAPSDLLGVGDDNVADPVGQSRARYEATAELLAGLLARVVDGAFPGAAVGAA